MEILKNNKKYFYNIPNDRDYGYLIDILSDLDIERTRINYKNCYVFSKKRILTKLKKQFKKNVFFEGIDNYDNSYMYTISLMSDDDFDQFFHTK